MASRQLVWITPDGEEFPLTNAAGGYRVTKGATGLGMPPVQLSTDATPLLDGVMVADVYAPPRTIQLPILILAGDRTLYRERARALVTALSYGQECALELRQPNGQRRRITAWYNGGLEGAEDKDTGGEKWARFVLKVLCPDPYWFDPVPITYPYAYVGSPVPFLGNPFLPIQLSPGLEIGATTITNPGEVKSWPVWTVTPPAVEVVFTDMDTGASIPIAAEVPDGLVLTVRTEPGKTDVRIWDGVDYAAGTDYWDALYGTPQFWPVRPGTSNVDLAITGAGAGSSITLTFYPRYLTPW